MERQGVGWGGLGHGPAQAGDCRPARPSLRGTGPRSRLSRSNAEHGRGVGWLQDTPTYVPQKGRHDALIILRYISSGKFLLRSGRFAAQFLRQNWSSDCHTTKALSRKPPPPPPRGKGARTTAHPPPRTVSPPPQLHHAAYAKTLPATPDPMRPPGTERCGGNAVKNTIHQSLPHSDHQPFAKRCERLMGLVCRRLFVVCGDESIAMLIKVDHADDPGPSSSHILADRTTSPHRLMMSTKRAKTKRKLIKYAFEAKKDRHSKSRASSYSCTSTPKDKTDRLQSYVHLLLCIPEQVRW